MIPLLLFIDYKKIFSLEFATLLLFIISLYGVYLNEHRDAFHVPAWIGGVISEVLLMSFFYLVGNSIFTKHHHTDIGDKKIFYLLYSFFIAYGIGILYSYFGFDANDKLSNYGFRVYYATQGLHFHTDGKIAVTIVSYLSSAMIVLMAMILLSFKSFRERRFSYLELLLMFAIGGVLLWISLGTGRRLAILLVIIASAWFYLQLLYKVYKDYRWYYTLIILFVTIGLLFAGYHSLQDTLAFKRAVSHHGFTDQRASWWLKGLKYIWQYPWGGADHIVVYKLHETKVHNTWIDIGKSYGLLAFVFGVIFYLMHIRYLYRILRSKEVSMFIKNIILLISFILFFNMMIEHIFDSSKEFILYSIFFLGFLKSYSDFVVKSSIKSAIH
ncbi:hypothetical protein MNB_SV-6-633 [hydrothermal vent metagenome]|uniref:Oligosaccharide repeat unit polymerase Wzy O-antigen ligase n=1 Tax=hydrothermal vent metagenome TaxID=652676 RepID=A0A1W1CCU9_9ZZZZ